MIPKARRTVAIEMIVKLWYSGVVVVDTTEVTMVVACCCTVVEVDIAVVAALLSSPVKLRSMELIVPMLNWVL